MDRALSEWNFLFHLKFKQILQFDIKNNERELRRGNRAPRARSYSRAKRMLKMCLRGGRLLPNVFVVMIQAKVEIQI